MPRCDQRFTPMAQRGQHWRWLWLVTAVVSTCFRNLGGETIGRVMLEPCLPFLDQPWAVYLRACWWFPNQRLNYIHDYIFPFLSVEVRQHVDCFGGILSSETAPLNTARCDPSSLPFCRKHLQYHQLQGKGIIIILSSYVSPYFRDIFPWRFRRSSRSSFRLAGSGSTSLRSTSARSRMLAPEGARIVDSAIIVWYQALLYPLNYSLYRLVSWLFFFWTYFCCADVSSPAKDMYVHVCAGLYWCTYIYIYMCVTWTFWYDMKVSLYIWLVSKDWQWNMGNPCLVQNPTWLLLDEIQFSLVCFHDPHTCHYSDCLGFFRGNPNQTSGWVWVVFLYLLVNICTVSLTFHEFPKPFQLILVDPWNSWRLYVLPYFGCDDNYIFGWVPSGDQAYGKPPI